MVEVLIYVMYIFSGEFAYSSATESQHEFRVQQHCIDAKNAFNSAARNVKKNNYSYAECVPMRVQRKKD